MCCIWGAFSYSLEIDFVDPHALESGIISKPSDQGLSTKNLEQEAVQIKKRTGGLGVRYPARANHKHHPRLYQRKPTIIPTSSNIQIPPKTNNRAICFLSSTTILTNSTNLTTKPSYTTTTSTRSTWPPCSR
jgi:hypothetical protein